MRKFYSGICLSLVFCALLCACGDSTSGEDSTKYNAFTDKRDGNVYRVVTIGKQTWMAENLRYDPLDSLVNGKYWCAEKSHGTCENGFLYNFYAVMNDSNCDRKGCSVIYPHRGICPEGWHVPENYEWKTLVEMARLMDLSLGVASEFNAEPTGEYNIVEWELKRDAVARYWTSTPKGTGDAYESYEWYVFEGQDTLNVQVYSPDFGYALRCVADSDPKLDTYVEFEVPAPIHPDSIATSSSRRAMSSSSVSSSSWESYVNDSTYDAFTDKRDGNVYRVVKIGTQVWMAENLRYHDLNASPTLNGRLWEWSSGEYLYSFAGVMDDAECGTEYCIVSNPHRGICPEGWHVPESFEWETLVNTARSDGISLFDMDGFNAGWNYEYSSTNRSVGIEGPDHHYARFWSATQTGALGADEWYADYTNNSGFKSQSYSKSFGYALRCVADAGEVDLDAKASSSSVALSSSSLSSSSSEPEYSSSSVEEESSSSSVSNLYERSEDWFNLEQITDSRDNNEYRVLQVKENLIWMAENLRYADSATAPALEGNVACVDGNRCEEGNLYTYAAAVNSLDCASSVCFESSQSVQGICPEGWRLPTITEWNQLASAITEDHTLLRLLAMLPTGERNGSATVKYDEYARFWLATELNSISAYEGYVSYGDVYLKNQTYNKAFGYAVRCVKDVEIVDN